MLSPAVKRNLKKINKLITNFLAGLLITGCGTSELIPTLEGYYSLPNGGFIELVRLENGSYGLFGSQRVLSVNFDGGLALHPNLPAGPHILKNGAISGVYNANYNSTTHDVEIDGTGSNISGNRLTQYVLDLISGGRLKITLITHDSSGLTIDASRVIISN